MTREKIEFEATVYELVHHSLQLYEGSGEAKDVGWQIIGTAYVLHRSSSFRRYPRRHHCCWHHRMLGVGHHCCWYRLHHTDPRRHLRSCRVRVGPSLAAAVAERRSCKRGHHLLVDVDAEGQRWRRQKQPLDVALVWQQL